MRIGGLDWLSGETDCGQDVTHRFLSEESDRCHAEYELQTDVITYYLYNLSLANPEVELIIWTWEEMIHWALPNEYNQSLASEVEPSEHTLRWGPVYEGLFEYLYGLNVEVELK